jgi:curli production assembly/transport component CsgG
MKSLTPLLVANLLFIAPRLFGAEILTLAVFDFESKDEAVRDLGPKAAALVSAGLSAEPGLITVERAELEKVLGEHELGLSGTVTPESAAKLGSLTGAKVLVTGRVFKVDKDLVIVAKIIGTETSRVYGEVVKGGGPESLTELSESLSKKIAATVAQKSETLVAKSETLDQRIDKLITSLPVGRRPAVTVKIPEHHIGQRVVDPAAETELILILQKAGFVVVDEKSKEKPDIEITGEAFSVLGLRKGNLISCKARIELKAHDIKARKLLLVDRQTSVAVDIAEQTAAKTALQEGAGSLASRLLPKLIK